MFDVIFHNWSKIKFLFYCIELFLQFCTATWNIENSPIHAKPSSNILYKNEKSLLRVSRISELGMFEKDRSLKKVWTSNCEPTLQSMPSPRWDTWNPNKCVYRLIYFFNKVQASKSGLILGINQFHQISRVFLVYKNSQVIYPVYALLIDPHILKNCKNVHLYLTLP